MVIYIINYLSLCAVAMFGLVFYHNKAMLALVTVLLAMPFISLFLTYLSKKKIDISVEADRTSVGKEVPVGLTIKIKNKWIVPFENCVVDYSIKNGFCEEKENYELYIPVPPFSERKANFIIKGTYCGRVVMEVNRLRIYDVFHLFRFTIPVQITKDFMVLPEKIIKLPQINHSVTGVSVDDEVQYKKGDDMSQVSQIRNYIPGDKLQNIHWKLSAKKGELQVKDFSLPFSDEVTLLVELEKNPEHPEIIDEIIETYYGAGRYLINNARRYKFACYNFATRELLEFRIENENELIDSVMEMYFMEPTSGMEAYNIYRAVHSEFDSTVLYIHGKNKTGIQGEKLNLSCEGVEVTCLS